MTNDTIAGHDTAGHAKTAGSVTGGGGGGGGDAGVATANARAEALYPLAMLSIVPIATPRSADHMKPAATGPR